MGRRAGSEEEAAERVSLEIEAEGGMSEEEGGGMLGGSPGGSVRASKRDVVKHFAVMGWTAFGGPAAHIAVFEKVFVQDRRWLTSGVFTEFLALGQCIPGPTSTQMAFAIGVVKQGIPGGLLSGGMFLHPGFIIMSIIGATSGGHLEAPSAEVRGLVAGFTAVAIALVAVAALGLGRKICTDRITVAICTATVAATLYYQKPWVLPLLMLSGGVVTTAAYWRKQMGVSDTDSGSITSLGLSMRAGGGLLAAWAALLVVLIAVLEATGRQGVWPPVAWFKIFYTAGSLIFGGGQVLLPLLLDEMTGTAGCSAGAACKPLMNEAQFYAGLAAAQSMPGPLFNFSAYLGAVIAGNAGFAPFLGTVVCWLGLFGPGVGLIFGILPFWGHFREYALYKRALPGINAAAVGLIFTAVLRMAFGARRSSPFPDASASIGVLGFVAVQHFKVPAPAAVVAGGLLGLAAHAGRMH